MSSLADLRHTPRCSSHPAIAAIFLTRFSDGALRFPFTRGQVRICSWMLSLGGLQEAFVLNRSQLNGHDPLTGRERAPVLMIASQTVFDRNRWRVKWTRTLSSPP